jgi:perosamine synthetase
MIPLFKVYMPPKRELLPELEKILWSGYIGQGPKVEEFEKDFANYLGIDKGKVLSVNSGTSALHLALRLAGVAGGEVITTPMTCTATNWPILANDAKIVWGDIDPETGMLDPDDVEKKITKFSRAIMVVHWGGTPANLDRLYDIGLRYNIPIIEDAAHALGAMWGDRKIGNRTADYTCFSLQAIKHITTIDGGFLITKSDEDYQQGKLLRWYGIDREGPRTDFRCEEDIKDWGYKFHMNDVTATIGLVALKHLDSIVLTHQVNAAYYNLNITNPKVKKPIGYERGTSSYWLYTLRVKSRSKFMKYLTSHGIQVSRVHARNDTHTVVREFAAKLPGVDEFESQMVCIPVHHGLTLENLQVIVHAINSW